MDLDTEECQKKRSFLCKKKIGIISLIQKNRNMFIKEIKMKKKKQTKQMSVIRLKTKDLLCSPNTIYFCTLTPRATFGLWLLKTLFLTSFLHKERLLKRPTLSETNLSLSDRPALLSSSQPSHNRKFEFKFM